MEKQSITSYEEAVDYINQIPKFTAKHSMEETKGFLHKLGDPDQKCSLIHVAGTNGKGSVCTYMRCILEAAGKRVAVFTSPHLTDIRERFIVEGKMPAKDTFLKLFLEIYEKLDWERLAKGEGYHPSYFEYLFFMGMLWFAEERPDFCILETGLGGRLDATNAVAAKLISVITHISLDHTAYLGNTTEAIAGEKAGIMKENTPVVFWDTSPQVSAVFTKKAEELGIPAFRVSEKDGKNINFHEKSIDFLCKYRYDNTIRLALPTIASYQVENALLAVKAIEILDRMGKVKVEPSEIAKGLKSSFWPGRMEEVLPEVYVDGAHNEDGIRAFLETVKRDRKDGKRILLFGVMADKDYRAMIKEIAASGLFDRIALTGLHSTRALDVQELLEMVCRQCENTGGLSRIVCESYRTTKEALIQLLKVRGDARIYIAGSLYLAGEIKEMAKNDQF